MKTLQLPLYHFLEPDESESVLHIDRMYVPATRMFVPYLSVPQNESKSVIDGAFVNARGRVPYAIELGEPKIMHGDWREIVLIKHRSKMLWWRRLLPECSIKQQYAAAELWNISGYTSLRAIESGAVIRELRHLYVMHRRR